MVQNKHPEIHLNFNLRVLVGEFPSDARLGGDMFECLAKRARSEGEEEPVDEIKQPWGGGGDAGDSGSACYTTDWPLQICTLLVATTVIRCW